MKAKQFSEQLKDAGIACFLTHGHQEPTIYVRADRDGPEIEISAVKVRDGRIILEFDGSRQWPTGDAYMGAMRALHWRTAQMRAHGIEPVNLMKLMTEGDLPHDPPEDFDWAKAEEADNERRKQQAASEPGSDDDGPSRPRRTVAGRVRLDSVRPGQRRRWRDRAAD